MCEGQYPWQLACLEVTEWMIINFGFRELRWLCLL
jgi:hypothetical protein